MRGRLLLPFCGALVSISLSAFSQERQPNRCELRIKWGEVPDRVTLDVIDASRIDLFNPHARVRAGEAGVIDIPCKPMLLIWRAPGGAVAEAIDPTEERTLALRPPKTVSGGVVVGRLSRSRLARDAAFEETRFRDVASEPRIADGLVVFQGLPFGTELEMSAPRSFCLDSQVKLTLTRKDPVASPRATICQCSDLRVRFEGGTLDGLAPIRFTLRRATSPVSGEAGPICSEASVDSVAPAAFGGLPAGEYTLETRVASRGLVRFDPVTIATEEQKEVTLAFDFQAVSGAVSYGGKAAQGELTFTRRDGPRRIVVSTSLTDEGRYTTLLPGPGRYMVQLRRGVDRASGPARFADVPAKAESTLDVDFEHATVSVHVVDVRGQPISGARVEVAVREKSRMATQGYALTDEAGLARFEDLQPGQFVATAEKPGFRPVSNPVSLPLEKDDVNERTIVLRKVRTTPIRALSVWGGPLPGLDVVCAPTSSLTQAFDAGRTDDSGGLEIDVEDRLPLQCGLASSRVGLAQVVLRDEQPVVVTLASTTSSLHLKFIDERGKPVAGQVVVLQIDGTSVIPDLLALQQAHWGGQIRSDAEGNLRKLGLPGGTIRILRVVDQKSMVAALAGDQGEQLATISLSPGETRSVVIHLSAR